MAEQAEGSIIIGTELNLDGFKAGSEEMLAAIKSLSEEAKNLGATLKGLFKKPLTPEVNTSSAEDQVAALEAQVRELEAAMEEMRDAASSGQTAAPEVNIGGTTQKASDLQRQIDSVNSSVERLEPTFQKAMSGSESAATSFEDRTAALESKIAQLQQRLEAVAQTKFPTQEYQEICAEAEKAGQKLESLLNKQEKIQSLGVKENSAQWKSLQYDIDLTARKYDELVAAKARMESSGTAFQMGTDTTQYAQMESALSAATSRLEEMKEQLEEVQGETSQSENHMGKLSDLAHSAASGIGKAAKSATGALARGIKSAVSHMAKLVFHGKKMDGQFSGLISGAKKFALSLLVARGVYALLRKAVSAYMAENQQLSNTLSACWSGIGNLLGPIITKLINLVAQAVAYVTSFLKLLGIFGESTTKAIGSAGSAASGAAKDLKRQLASFDELNILSANGSDGSGGGGGSGNAGAELPDVTLPDWAKLIAEQMKAGNWAEAGHLLGTALNDLIDGVDWSGWGKRLGTGIQNGIRFALGFIRTTDWENLGTGIAAFLNNAIGEINPKDLGALLASKLRIAIDMVYGFVTTFDWSGFGIWLSGIVVGWFDEIDWVKAAQALSAGIKGALKSAAAFLKKTDWKDLGAKIGEFLKNIEWGDMLSGLWEVLKDAGKAILDVLDGLVGGLGGVLPVIKAIGAAFAAWKIASGVEGALGKVFGLLGKKTGGVGGFELPSPKKVLAGLADLTLIIGGMMVLLAAVNEVSKAPGFEDAMSGGLSAIKAAFKGLGEVGIQVAATGVVITALGKVGVKTIAKGVADLAMILVSVPTVITAVGAILSISGFQDFLGVGVGSIKTAFEGIGDVALEIGVFSAIIAGLGFANPATIGAGLVGFAEIIGGLELILVALGALNQIPGFSWIVGEGGEVLMQLGEILGGFAGSIVSGLMTTISDSFPEIADNLSLFAQKLEPFLTAMESVDEGVASAAKTLAEAILAFSGASLIDAVTSWITGGKSLVDFGEQLAQFGPKFAEYADSVSGVDPAVVEASANAASAMASLAKEIPGQGGVLQWLLGSQDIGAFGTQLKTFGECFSDYSNSTNTNQFCLMVILCRIRSSFDYLIYPYYPAYMG